MVIQYKWDKTMRWLIISLLAEPKIKIIQWIIATQFIFSNCLSYSFDILGNRKNSIKQLYLSEYSPKKEFFPLGLGDKRSGVEGESMALVYTFHGFR